MSNENVRRYATSGDVDEALYTDMLLYNYMSPRQRKIHLANTAILVLAYLLIMIDRGPFDWRMCLVIVLLIALEFMPFWLKKKAHLSFREAAKDGKLSYATAFTDAEIHIENHTNGASADVPLNSFRKILSVRGVWALVSKAGSFYVVFADQLSDTDRASVLELLKQHNPKIKLAKAVKRCATLKRHLP